MALHLVPRGCSNALVARRNAIPIPIVCLDARVRQWAACFSRCFSKPHYQHFVTVLLGLLLCQEARTLTGLQRQVAGVPSIASLSRFIYRHLLGWIEQELYAGSDADTLYDRLAA